MEDKILQLVIEDKEISWKSIIYDLIKSEQMDAWDINVSLIAQKYIERLKQYKNIDLKISGKVILAAALLLKIKSKRLSGEDLNEFDRLLAAADIEENAFYDSLEQDAWQQEREQAKKYELYPRTPQPRKRKVSVYDLVKALEKALEVKYRRLMKKGFPDSGLLLPKKTTDITLSIKQVYKKILEFMKEKNHPEITFNEILASQSKTDKIFTFIPLMHLSTQRKVDVFQKEHLGDINIRLVKEK